MKHGRNHITLLIVTALIMIMIMASYAYMYWKVGETLTAGVTARNAIASETVNSEREQAIISSYQSSAADWARLRTFAVPSSDVVSFIDAVDSLGTTSGAQVTISGIGGDNLDNVAPGSTGKIHAHVAGTGPWANVMRTLELAENMPFATAIKSVNLSSSGSADAHATALTWSISFDMDALMIASSSSSRTRITP